MSRRPTATTEEQHFQAHTDPPLSGHALQADLLAKLLRQLTDCQRAARQQRSEAQAASQRVLQLEGQLASSQREGEQLQHQGRAADTAARAAVAQRDRALAERSRLLSEVRALQQRTAEAQRRLREAVGDGERLRVQRAAAEQRAALERARVGRRERALADARQRAEHLRSVVRGLEGENTQLRLSASVGSLESGNKQPSLRYSSVRSLEGESKQPRFSASVRSLEGESTQHRLSADVRSLESESQQPSHRADDRGLEGQKKQHRLSAGVRTPESENKQHRLRADGSTSSPSFSVPRVALPPSPLAASGVCGAESLLSASAPPREGAAGALGWGLSVALLQAASWLLRSLGCPLAAALCGLLAVVALLAVGRGNGLGFPDCLCGAEGTVHTALLGGSLALEVVLLSEVSLMAGVSVALLALAALPRLLQSAGRTAPPSLLVGPGSTARLP
eukprot:m51a1_g12584 hypothetical protein (450) ;mRNA; r:1725-3074